MHETLIKRLEAATGPDRELDAEIFQYAGCPLPTKFASREISLEWSEDDKCFVMSVAGTDMRIRYEHPHFTGSLDAAMTLMPKINRPNFPWLAIKSNNPNNPIGCRCELWLDNVKNYNGRGETLAIALCIAALKAREVINADD